MGLKLLRRGKVRDIYEVDKNHLLLVASDRVSAFDYVLTPEIPDKGRVLTRISRFWFEKFDNVPNHCVSYDVGNVEGARKEWEGRVMLVRRAEVIPYEFIVRGYLAGSSWEQYCRDGTAYGYRLPEGLSKGAKLPEPILTPTTKALKGHDEPVTFQQIRADIGSDMAERIFSESLRIYSEAAQLAAKNGLILADTKFEWGIIDGKLHLVDELLTPDSSRYWDAKAYRQGRLEQFDKQIVRDYLLRSDWDRKSPPPPLPQKVVDETRRRYLLLLERLTGERL